VETCLGELNHLEELLDKEGEQRKIDDKITLTILYKSTRLNRVFSEP